MLKNLQNHINKNLAFLNESKILIAISGGIDSVVLTHLCHQLKLNIALAHCNFHLRGEESNGDEESVKQLAEQLGLEVFVQNFDTENYAKTNKQSIQIAARELRYNWFEDLANQLEFDYILTAHHADDNLETFLINFTRGTGLEGLTGIPEVNTIFVRPLLPFSSEAIEHYAKVNTIAWRDDRSNASTKYVRNKLRHNLIPILKEINPSLLQSFQTTLSNLNDTTDLVKDSVDNLLSKAIVSQDDDKTVFKISEFKSLRNPKAYLFEVFKDYGFTEWNDVLNLLDAESGKQLFSATYRLIKNREHLLLSEINNETEENILISKEEKQIESPFGLLFFDEADAIFGKRTEVIYVDADTLEYPLILRKWEDGDFFHPLGMSGKKKISKYLKDEKLSLLDKEQVWVLCSNNAIVWVVNRRADNRFKVTENTKNILKITLQ
ncbi:tRNA lysidine(34) synthetase TilS [Algibacter lectus]|uniref:tRNA(Ile)-lysidine synthase n=1 Tax=Algibacter lectus TaxID=221126 RepID=A0A090VB58_9FLAO|nr:tRNA lysidine(34) synthetase TilS [Algibacter lectus]GAL61981.1 tRNA(Ile)-lysidine synthetase [Algibacter lectus]SFC45607.1 tRNA(Ile)-lysidine synthase [Algibacter lectus]